MYTRGHNPSDVVPSCDVGTDMPFSRWVSFLKKKLVRTLTMALVAAAYYTDIFQQTESSISKA